MTDPTPQPAVSETPQRQIEIALAIIGQWNDGKCSETLVQAVERNAAERLQLERCLRQCEQALTFYANGDNWKRNSILDGESSNFAGTQPAADALASIRKLRVKKLADSL